MNFLGCLLSVIFAVVIYLFMAARHTLAFFYRMMNNMQPRDEASKKREPHVSRPANDTHAAQGEGLFEQEGRQYVDFEEIKDE